MSRKVFSNPAERIMVAFDVDELSEAKIIAESIRDLGVTFKIGNQLGTYEGWKAAIEFAHEYGALIFCDTKFKDIPETVKKSSRAMTRLEPDFFNVMADTTLDTLKFAVDGVDSAVQDFAVKKPILLGVTVLTSISNDESVSIYGADSASKVLQFATSAAQAGLDGVVCSAQEASALRDNPATTDLLLVTPGIRPEWAASGDQQRITTPKQAIENGADYLVIGRPITQPPSEIGTPRDAILKIIEEIS
jgi:orotidine-5'-phosphate decarboxylase